MTKHKYIHNRTPFPGPEIAEIRAPYWARAHRDWRFLTIVFVMLGCIALYVLTGNFGWTNRGQTVPILELGAK